LGAAEELKALRDEGRLKEAPADVEMAERLVSQAGANLRTVRDILNRTGEPNPGGAVMLLWDGAAFQLLAAGLQLAGYRLTSSAGHHRTAIDAIGLISGKRGLMIRLDALRRMRDQVMYDGSAPDASDVTDALSDVDELAAWTTKAIERGRELGGRRGPSSC
jgi:hypothetical protein